MSEETTRPVPTYVGKDGVSYASTVHSPVDNKVRAEATVPPWTVVPVIFVPGVMGSNLKAKAKITLPEGGFIKEGARVWKVDSATSVLGMWGKDGSYRQAVLDKNALIIDNGGKIATKTKRGDQVTPQSRVHADEAKKRGWGTAGWGFYGAFIDWLQYQLADGRLVGGKPNAVFENVAKLVGTSPQGTTSAASALTDAQVKKMLDIHFPVYAVGYNWLQSNMDSGRDLVNGTGTGDGRVMGIDEIIQRHNVKTKDTNQVCHHVIVVTHSMGGLVARAAAMAHGAAGKVLGIVHGVQPIDGAAAFYKRLAAGFQHEGWGVPWATSHILGPTSKETIPELAYNPGPLELAPNKRYSGGKPWLFIKDRHDNVLKALPENGDPYTEIYLDTTHVWRAVNPEWLDPAQLYDSGSAQFAYEKVVKKARGYHDQLGGQLHPKTYAHWGADADHESWGSMTWTAKGHVSDTLAPQGAADSPPVAPDPAQWTFQMPVKEAGTKRELLNASNQTIRMSVDGPSDLGDGTVPATASGAQIANYAGCQIACALTGFDHQGDYNDDQVRDVLLDALARLVEPVVVTD